MSCSGPGNVVARHQDHGDLWELYKGLDGGSRVAMTTRQQVPNAASGLQQRGDSEPATQVAGPVFSEHRVSRSFDSGRFATIVRVYTSLRRIDVTTRLINREKFVRYQVLFPTTIKGGTNTHEIPFGAIERPAMIEFPAQNWVDWGDGSRGLAVLNVGLPGNLMTDGTMWFRCCATRLGRTASPVVLSRECRRTPVFSLGRSGSCYALVPHAGDWREAGIFRDGLEFNHPLVCRNVLPHAGTLPPKWGLLEVLHPNVVVSSLKPGRGGGIALRMYEAAGKPAPGVKVKLRPKLVSAAELNLLEDAGRDLSVENNTVSFDMKPFEIKTIRLRLGGN